MNTQYNSLPYNSVQYNLTESIDLTISHSIGSSDVLSKNTIKPLQEVSVLLDNSSNSISEKRLSDSLRINDWLEVKQNPKSDPWGD